jgi:hypothetical protein
MKLLSDFLYLLEKEALMRILLLLALLVVLPLGASADVMLVDLSQGIKTHLLSATGIATGSSYKGKGLKLTITNKSGSAIRVRVNQGVIFRPEADGPQPLVLAGEEMLRLEPFKEGSVEVQTFCADSRGSAPSASLNYSFSHVGSDTLIKLLQYVKKNAMLDDLGQAAVWVLTNGHTLNNVYDPYRDIASKKLVDYLATLTGLPAPDYYVMNQRSQEAGAPVYTPKTLKIFAQFEHVLAAPEKLTLGVFKEDGSMLKRVFENRNFGKGAHRHRVEFEATGVEAGNYYIRLMSGQTVLQEKKVLVQ